MTTRLLFLATLSWLLLSLTACGKNDEAPPPGASSAQRTTAPILSGIIEGGLRVLTIDPGNQVQHYRIYRGDYIRVRLVSREPFTIEMPSLGVTKQFPAPEGENPYIKVPDAGVYPFRIGKTEGVIEALEFQAAAYREVTAREGTAVIANLKPLVLDVRSPGEYAAGHLEGALLIPIQELQGRMDELKGREKETVVVYCKTGNRSTVAAKFLVEAGFEQVINLRRGIEDWIRSDLPVVK